MAKAYLAVTKEEYTKIWNAGGVATPSVFTSMPQGKFFKLFPSIHDAVILGALRAHTLKRQCKRLIHKRHGGFSRFIPQTNNGSICGKQLGQ